MKIRDTIEDLVYRGGRLVSKDPGLIFLWIPKTAGTSLFEALRFSLGMKMYKRAHRLPRIRSLGFYTFCHLHYPSLRKMRVISQPVHQHSLKFAVIRNPYRRAVSLYFYLLRPRMSEASGAEFNSFLKGVMNWRPSVGVYNHVGLMHANPQVDWLIGENGLVVDKLFDIDALDDCLDDIQKYTGRPIATPARRNVSGYSTRFAHTLLGYKNNREMIEEIYKRDFELLGYPRASEESG
jgi:hypothetical protein